jgi:hypothetical protein
MITTARGFLPRALGIRALVLLVVLAWATACVPTSPTTSPPPTTSSPPSASTGPTAPVTSTASSSSSSSGAPAGTSGSASESGATVPPCTTGDLDVSLAEAEGGAAAGSNYLLVQFRNTAAIACTLYGWPGVSLVGDGNGTQLGAPASRVQPDDRRIVRIEPGKQATALLRVTQAGNYGHSCDLVSADGFRIYVPDQTAAVFVTRKTPACRKKGVELMEIAPVGTPS